MAGTEHRPVWYACYDGRIQPFEKNPGAGWSEVIHTDQLPDNYNPEEDRWVHLVVGPDGPVLVPLTPTPEGGWKREGDVLTLQQWMKMAATSGDEIWGVGGSKGQMKELKRWA